MKKTTIEITGMSCAACAQTVQKALQKLDGVKEASVNIATEKAAVNYDESSVNYEELKKAVEASGYGVADRGKKAVFKVSDMTCASCAQTVSGVLNRMEGVKEATLNFAAETATVIYDADLVDIDKMKKAVSDIGYGLKLKDENDRENTGIEELKRAKDRMSLAWYITVPIVLWMIPEMFFGITWPSEFIFNLGMVLLALPILAISGRKTFKSAYGSVRHLGANMDLLIAMGSGAAFITGIASLFLPVANYAGVAGMIIAFHLTGKYIESKAKGRASQAIEKLLKLGAKTARVVKDEKIKEIPVKEIEVGDIMLVKPGEKIPTDGIIIEGETAIDESMATGESVPVDKKEDDEVIGATVNQMGLIKVKATKIGQDTFLSQVIKLVEEAQGTKVPIQAFADKVTSYFVPAVLVVAALTFASWLIFPGFFEGVLKSAQDFIPWVDVQLSTFSLAVFAAVAVLVIACPCALGLATPTALMVGSGKGAENGILIKDGAAIQIMKEVDIAVFDKTGTITEGKPKVTDIIANEMKEPDVIKWAASLESGSEHPLAAAVVRAAKERGIEISSPKNFKAVSGKGAEGTVAGTEVKIGSKKYLDKYIKDDRFIKEIKSLEKEGKTVVLLAVDKKISAAIAIADSLKKDSAEAIESLHRMGIKTAVITGDNKRTARAIAQKVNIDEVIAEVMPRDKSNEIKRLQAEGLTVAMVGDGINDAPALTQADVGIAIGTGTDIAIESSDITLVGGTLDGVVKAIKLSKATFKKIKQNLYWAFGYNVLAIPVAVLGLLHPVIAEAAMAMSSITVVTNANRLRKIEL